MGKVIKTELNRMSWLMKTSLVLLLTVATSMFMYQGWSGPKQSNALGTSTITTCGGCHGNPPVDGTGRNTPPGQFAGSHSHHSTTCTDCHANNTVYSHSNRMIDIANPLRAKTGESYSQVSHAITNTPTYGSCTTYCHSLGTSKTSNVGETRTATLSTPLTTLNWAAGSSTCASCHGNPPTNYTSGATTWGAAKANSHSGHTVFSCDVCHYATTTTGTTITTAANHANGTYNITANTAKTGTFTYSYAAAGGTCAGTLCHVRTVAWGANLGAVQCDKCHTKTVGTTFTILDGTTNSTKSTIHVSHVNKTHGLMTAGLTCDACHTAVTSAGLSAHLTAAPAEVTMVGALGATGTYTGTYPTGTCASTYCHSRGGTTPSPTFGTTLLSNTFPGDCQVCHPFPPNTGTHAGQNYTAGQCYTCHTHVTTTGYAFSGTGVSLHIDGKVDSTASCYGCHKSVQSARASITGQFTSAKSSHHYQGATITDTTAGAVCYACHWEATSSGSTTSYHKATGGKVQLVVWGTSTTRPTTYNASTYALYSSSRTTNSTRTEIAKINNHCLGCHNETNKNTQPFALAGDTRTPSYYSWESKPTTAGGFGGVAQSIDAKYSQPTTTLWGKFSGNFTNAKSGQTKALSAHGQASLNQRGWSTVMESQQHESTVNNFPNMSGAANVLCFDCHNSHGSLAGAASTNAVTSSYVSDATGANTGAILKNTVAGVGGYAMAYRPYSGGNAASKNVYKAGAGLCFDCHNNSTVGSATSTGSTTPWGYSATFNGSQVIHGYNDTPYYGKANGTFAKTQTFPYLVTLSTNRGGHFGASSNLGTTTARTIGGLCTPCHDPHGVSPGIVATNMQYAVPLLKGTFVTSPYKQDAAPAKTNESRGGGSTVAVKNFGSTAGYHIDQNTMQSAKTNGKPTAPTTATGTPRSWTFATSAKSLQTYNDTQFAGLCLGCHSKTTLNSTVAATSATGTAGSWKSMTRIHNSVNGWATTTGGNANNKTHAYTCSKCHSTHNSRLPRLLVTNCLDIKHRGRAATGGTMTGLQSAGSDSSTGSGRFPGGGAGSNTSRTYPGPWWFGKTGGSPNTTNCHDSATAGGSTYSGTGQQWNTKSIW